MCELAVQVRRATDQVTDRLGGRGPLTTTSGQRTRAPRPPYVAAAHTEPEGVR